VNYITKNQMHGSSMSTFRKVSMRTVSLRILILIAVASAALSLIGSVTAHQNGSTSSSGKQDAAAPPKPQTQPGTDMTAGLSVPPGATPEMVALGFHLFRGEAGGGTCYTCHGADAKGTPLAPDLTDDKWLWSDGSWQAIIKTITDGVPHPKEHHSQMPPRGGTQFTPEQAAAVAAYVWALSHHSPDMH
jgi:mono/diheme cytochrome c family protein